MSEQDSYLTARRAAFLAARFFAAQRFRCASAMRCRPSSLIPRLAGLEDCLVAVVRTFAEARFLLLALPTYALRAARNATIAWSNTVRRSCLAIEFEFTNAGRGTSLGFHRPWHFLE